MVVGRAGAFKKVIVMVTELLLLDLGMYFLISEAVTHRLDNVLGCDCNRHLSVACRSALYAVRRALRRKPSASRPCLMTAAPLYCFASERLGEGDMWEDMDWTRAHGLGHTRMPLRSFWAH